MATFKDSSNHPGTQRSSGQHRRSRAKKKRPEQGGEEEPNEVEKLLAKGWTKKKNITANKVFLSGQLIIEGLLHATDKLCLHGDFVVTDKLECEGNFTLSGTVWLWNKPAMVKNMIILTHGTIHGDVIVSAGAYIKGQCTITGKLTVTGTLRLNGTLKCKRLSTTSPIEKFGLKSKVIVEEEDESKSEDAIAAELVRLLCGHETGT
ncbi:hypothetical protein F5B21DRAFT_468793 [Xylaria acuta]|nr:hypothetical protein F5B21DRAFT_468793 [Xylaria acuta]